VRSLQWFRKIVTIILAGGQGERLYPLTRDRSKPSVPYGGVYRIIDFTLSNCVNSGLRRIYVLTQYKSFSLDKHLQKGWNFFDYEADEFLYRIPPQRRVGLKWYEGTADAIFQNIYLLERHRPEHVLILSGDHIYKMDYNALLDFHLERNAALTVSTAVVPRDGADQFGIIEADAQWRVTGFTEKPPDPRPLPDDPDHCLVNMGVYCFQTEALVRAVCHDARVAGSRHDFGRDIIPALVEQGGVYACPFRDPATGRPAYWRDIGTLDSYYAASMDLVSREPEFNLYDRDWPYRTWQAPVPPAKSVHGFTPDGQLAGMIENSIVGGGTIISGGRVERSILGRNVRVNSYSRVTDSIVFDDVSIGRYAELHRAIVDKDVIVPEGMIIGRDPERDHRLFKVTEDGLVVVPKGMRFKD
jgi:glucose-1-phosphate adenylyltransferase